MIVNNAAISLGLALIALIVGRAIKRPFITHLLWLLVLMKLLTPPIIMIPAFPVAWVTAIESHAAFDADVRTVGQDMEKASFPGNLGTKHNTKEEPI